MATLTSDSYQVGEVIYTEEPFIRVLRHDLWDQVCAGCFEINNSFVLTPSEPVIALQRDTNLKKCGGCGIMKFCGKNCQRKAWPDHKLECPFLRNYTDYRHQPFVHMIGNIILKLKGRDWKTVTERILGKEVSFDDLISHADDPTKQNLIVDSQAIADPLTSYIGKENMPNEATLLELLGKVVHNRFGFTCENSSSRVSEGWALFIGVSKLDHSCVPNAVFKINGSSLTVRAIKTVQKSEKVTITYCPMITATDSSFLHKALKRSFRENCYCNDCSQPFGQSDLTKILDMSKASEVLEETDSTLQLVSLLVRLKYPTDIVTCDKLKQLLQNQEGVLGKTNLRRMQILVLLSFKDGPNEEKRKGLVELTEAMKEVWGAYYPELIPIYKKLINVNFEMGNLQEAKIYTKKISQLEAVCFGKKPKKSNAEWRETLSEKMFECLLDEIL